MPNTPKRRVSKTVPAKLTLATDVAGLIAHAKAKPAAPPALLLPLRLEYRVLEVDEPVVIGRATETRVRKSEVTPRAAKAARSAGTGRTEKATRASTDRVRFARDAAVKEGVGQRIVSYRVPQLWLRWFPDDSFGATDSPEPTDDEQAATAHYASAVAAAGARLGRTLPWYDTSDAELTGDWQALVREVGFFRAMELMRRSHGGGSPGSPGHQPFIVGLPDRVSVFALKGVTLTYLGQGAQIPGSVRYSPDALAPGEWLTDFDRAVRDGMGMRLKGVAYESALGADWLIATGLRPGDAKGQLERFVAAASAAGDLELLPQDTPTNNSARDTAGYETWIRDPVEALTRTSYAERRAASAPANTDADVLAAALGLAPAKLYGLRNAELHGVKDAREMATALLPALTAYFDVPLGQESVGGDAWREFMARSASSRGPLPALRIGENPYGILPVSLGGALAPPVGSTAAQGTAFNFVQGFAGATIAANESLAATLPIVRPGMTDQTDAVRRILQTLPVSTRLDVTSGIDTTESGPVGCPLVSAEDDPSKLPSAYGEALLSQPLAQLPDATAGDKRTPLLYRLLRLSLETILGRAPASLRGLSARGALLAATPALSADQVVRQLRDWVAAVEWLRTLGRPELEVLMLEVIDLLDHRIDAWQTALATFRLEAQRAAGDRSLAMGYYGMLAAPRATSATGITDGYVQAPSVAQAVTAGLLRSGALRHTEADGPFRVNLSSRRARKGLKTLDAMRKGLTLAEVLGYHAERWLHDAGLDALLYELRDSYSVRRGTGADATTLPLLDGRRLLGDAATLRQTGSTQRRQQIGSLLDELADQMDALSDVVVAEAVHQLAHGSPGGVNAWMKVLSGSAPPPESVFLKTHRSGHGSSYRAAYLSGPVVYTGTNPRAIAEPLLAELAAAFTTDFAEAAVRATISVPDQGTSEELVLELDDDLELDPIDLLVGGETGIHTRVRAVILARWQAATSGMRATLGELPATDIAGFLNQKRPLTVDLTYTVGGSPSARALLDALAPLGDLASRARPLTPGDLNTASASEGMDAATFSARYAKGVVALRQRAQKLHTAIGNALVDLTTDGDAAVVRAREIRRRDAINEVPGTRTRSAEISALLAAKLALERTLFDVSKYGLADALAPFAMQDLIDAPDGYEAFLRGLRQQLSSKLDGLQAAIDASMAGSPARPILDGLTAAIQAATDGEVIKVWPPCDVKADTTPDVGAARTVADAYGGWPQVRPSLRSSIALSGVLDTLAVRMTARRPTTDPRKPASSHVAMYLLPDGTLPTTTAAGFVFDEWTDFRPSATQTTGLAINYDSPQSEPPHVLLLCVAPNDGLTSWTDAILAGVVQEAIRLMRVRALTSQTSSFVNLGLRAMNLVPPAPGGKRGQERIPGPDVFRLEASGDRLFAWSMVGGRPQPAHLAQSGIERRSDSGGER